MSKDKLNDENFGTRDKRGHWKPFGTISINPPREIFLNPIKLLKYFFKYPGIFFPWTFVFWFHNCSYIFISNTFIGYNENISS